ncbi:MAG: M55 family metallopeptidase [Armatimonadota bacterium]
MKIYLLCDMEGTSGIWRREQVDSSSPMYQQGRELLMADVNAAIAGAYEGGAKELVVCDTHGGGPNFLIEKMDPRPWYETPSESSPLPSLDESFAGLILMCHHAMAGTQNAFLDHTQSSMSWFDYKINGESYGEIGQETAYAGHFGVPLIMVTGDEAACAETERQFPGAVTVAVKRAQGRSRARCMHPGKAHELIRRGAAEAVRKATALKPFRPTLPITLELTFYRTDMADSAAARPGNERVGPRTVRRVVQQAAEVLTI